MDRKMHRAAVEAGYADLSEYVERWGNEVKFIGDLSLEDASILEFFGSQSKSILEFGAGGSTQIFAQCQPDVLISVETAQEWIDKTKRNIERFRPCTDPVFVQYGSHPRQDYDLIFVDGVWDLRRDFAQSTWPLLKVGGQMIFHDTRRWFDAENVLLTAKMFYDEVDTVHLNIGDSNCSTISKRDKVNYVDWNKSEGKPAWMYGRGDPPEGLV